MIYEVRTYDLQVRSLGEVEKLFGENLPVRLKYSPLGGFFHTEIGPLNQIIHIWPYADIAERTKIRSEASKEANWPPPIAPFIKHMTAEIVAPLPFSPELKPGKNGPVYELRTYQCKPGSLPLIVDSWGPLIEERAKRSPLIGAWFSDLGVVNKFMHLWAYESLEHRSQVRAQAQADGIWPPKPKEGKDYLVSMENKILLPASFSPLQ